ncbi:MAG: FAD-dependent oxidoreductase [Clostridiales bacterium]|jgi:NADPH-dependent glutamate synthase beta subunit-like oxidoreductase/NAD-dependent dihydropyrimidine dehydrogenase PreA subunit|nr:FAD-dependent oxidoreductase [Clostridiales bacterium]
MEHKEKVLMFANKVGNKKNGAKSGMAASYTWDDPEYKILEPVVTDEMAEVALGMDFRVRKNAEEIAKACGKDLETTKRCLYELADAGVCFVNNIDGVDVFWYDSWIPGIMEMMVNHPTNPYKYPQIAEAFEAYGRIRGPKSSGAFPVGVGLMRVIPVEKAIDGNSRACSYEEISKYLDEAHKFSVSNCSCRTSREILGEGCGHLKEDMCIQLDHAAEYYIRTGRGREITREEAYEIIKRAEENGLMHQIPNTDGSGKTHAICNCCGCSCYALRTSTMFKNNDMSRSNYVARVDKEKCVACGQCVENCPTNAIRLGQKLCAKTPVVTDITTKVTPRDYKWTEDKWDKDYRVNRKNVVDTGTSPCKTTCPAHIAVQGYIRLAAQGKYREALDLIKKENPFPAVCGRICPHACESECTRGEIDQPIAIDEIKKFIADQELRSDVRFVPKKRHDYSDKKIAIVGAGPAGLSCAYFLALDGYSVTVFEKQEKLGGMLTLGIPSFRLEKDVVNAEIDILRELGVEFKTGVEVGKDVTLDELRAKGYKGFYLAIGAQAGRKLGIEGEDAKGVIAGVDFLRDVNLGKDAKLSGKVVVIGGGNVAIDVARTAVRENAETVNMYCLESASEMPALPDEIEEANAENININNGWGPKRILVADGKVTGVEFRKCISVFENGKFAPKYDDNNVITVPADYVLLSVGQSIDWGKLLEGSKVELGRGNAAVADGFTYQTAQPDVFVGGDVFTGPKFAIDAIAAGKQGAVSLHRFVQPGQDLRYGRDRREYCSLDKSSLIISGFDNTPRQSAGHNHESSKSFKDTRLTFTEEQMKKETERCLGCGAAIVDEYTCVGCGQCTTKCKFDAIHLERIYDGEGVSFEKMKPVVLKTMLKREGKIAVRKVKDAFSKKD